MTGLEKITQKIIADAEARAEQIIQRAQESATSQVQEAESEGKKIIAQAIEQSHRDAKTMEVRMQSMAEATLRKDSLDQRRVLVEAVLEGAIVKLNDASEADRTKLYIELIKNCQQQEGEIILNAHDQVLAESILAELGSCYKVAHEQADIKGGLLIRNGDVIENLSYDLVIRNQMPELSALVSGILFAGK